MALRHSIFGVRISLGGLLVACGAWAVVASIAGFLGAWWWVFDNASHFRVQYVLALAPALVICLVRKAWRTAAVFGLAIAANAAVVLSHLPPRDPAIAGDTLSVAAVNVHTANGNHARLLAWLREAKPDIAVVQEVDEAWMASLAALADVYPHVTAEPRDDNFGIAVFSRTPLPDARIEYLGSGWVPQVVATISVGGEPATLLAVHTIPPGSRAGTMARDELLRDVAAFVKARRGPVVVAGDLNITPWSPRFAPFRNAAGLHGASTLPTWPSPYPALLRIPIDQVMATREIAIAERLLGPDIGSDHVPLVVKLARTR